MIGFRQALALLVIGTLGPVIVFSVVIVYYAGRQQEAATTRALQDAARTVVVAVDKHFDVTITALGVLGSSPHLDAGDLAAFHRQAVRALDVRDEWASINLFDVSGQRLLVTAEPFGAQLPGPPPVMTEPFRRLVASKVPNVSDLFLSPRTGRPAVSVGVPVLRDGAVRWVLSAGLRPDALGRMVAREGGWGDWTVTLVDRRGQVVAESLPGRAVSEARRLGGVLTASAQSPAYGWSARITMPIKATGIGPPERLILGVGLVVLLCGLAIAGLVGRRIARPIEALARAAPRYGRGESVEPIPSRVREIAALSTALRTSSERLAILHAIDQALIAARTPEAICQATLPRVRELLGVPRVIVNLFDMDTGEVEGLAAAGRHRVHVGPGVRYPLSFAGDVEALRRGEPQVMNVDTVPPGADADALRASGVQVYVVVPMIVRGELIGSVSVGKESLPFAPEQIAVAQELTALLAIAIQQARLNERVQRHAEELEARVLARTAALEAAQVALVRKERLATLGQLAGGVAHELRTPIGVIKNATYFLTQLAATDDDKVRGYLAMLERAVDTTNRIVDDLLDYARIPSPRREATSLNALVRDHLDRAGIPAGIPDGIALALTLAADLPDVDVDRHQLDIVLGNLVRNATQAMPAGGQLTIETATDDTGAARLTVGDTGVGIAPEHLAQIFEPLFTTKPKGVGLGLAIVKELVEANGGTIAVESAPGAGTRFTLRFPAPPA